MNNEEIIEEVVETVEEVVDIVSEETEAPSPILEQPGPTVWSTYKVTNMFGTEIASFSTEKEANEFVQDQFANNGVTGLQILVA